MNNKEAIEHLKELKTLRIEFPNALQEQALDLAIKALEFKYQITHGDCDYCKHKNYASFKYPCTVCSKNNLMWEETEE